MIGYENKFRREEYLVSVEYKMCCIFAAYRRLACITGTSFSEQLRKNHANSKAYSNYTFDKNFLLLAENGSIPLSDSELHIYARYISKSYGYDAEKLYDEVKKEAEHLELNRSITENLNSILKAISNITSRLS